MRLSDLVDLNAIIANDCSKALVGPELFRGTNTKGKGVHAIRQDRRPLDSNQKQVAIFDFFCERLNEPFRKSNTLSVTVEEDQAGVYGNYVYQIFPFNGSRYMYSNFFDDFASIPKRMSIDIEELETAMNDHSYQSAADAKIKKFMKDNEIFFTNNLQDCKNAAGEILVYGTKYVANPIGNWAYSNNQGT